MPRSAYAEPVAPAPGEDILVRELEHELAGSFGGPAFLVAADGRKLEVPGSVFEVLTKVVHAMARGDAVAVVPVGALLTTQQAADLLDISRPYVVRLVEAGDIPHEMVGTHRRIRFADVKAYKRKRDAKRRRALEKLTREAEELGIEY